MYQTTIYRKDLSWLHFCNEPRAQNRQEVKDQQPYISSFVTYLAFPRSSRSISPDIRTVLHAWLCGRFIESSFSRKKHYRTNQGPSYLGGSYNNSNLVSAPIVLIQFKSGTQPQHFKRWFFRPIHFHIIGISINRPVKQNETNIETSIETNKPLPASFQSVL